MDPAPALREAAMKDPHCIIGRHEWQTMLNREGEPYEICSRTGCGKIRKTGSRFDRGGPYDPGQPPGPTGSAWSI